MPDEFESPHGERLAKRVAVLRGCSRAQAERLIESGQVRVDGVVADDPARRVHAERIEVDPDAVAELLDPVTLLWHKPAGIELVEGQALAGLIAAGAGLSPWQLRQLRCASPMPATSSGLAVFSQNLGVLRKLREDGLLLEHEWMLDLAGAIEAAKLETLAQQVERLALGPRQPYLKLSVSSRGAERTRLRLALKTYAPAALPGWLRQAGLKPIALHRLRLGRVALGAVEVGHWRLLGPYERF